MSVLERGALEGPCSLATALRQGQIGAAWRLEKGQGL